MSAKFGDGGTVGSAKPRFRRHYFVLAANDCLSQLRMFLAAITSWHRIYPMQVDRRALRFVTSFSIWRHRHARFPNRFEPRFQCIFHARPHTSPPKRQIRARAYQHIFQAIIMAFAEARNRQWCRLTYAFKLAQNLSQPLYIMCSGHAPRAQSGCIFSANFCRAALDR